MEPSPKAVTSPVAESVVKPRPAKAAEPVAKPGSSVVKETGTVAPEPPTSFSETARTQ